MRSDVGPRVHAVVVTYERKALLVACLEALAAQAHPLAGVLVVDNASQDGTLEHLLASGVADRLPVDYLRLERNGGGAEGFHYGVRHALRCGADWLWLMDDDCEAPPDSLERLLAHPRAADPSTALLAPLVTTPSGELLALNRGWLRRRWFLGPLVGLGPEHVRAGEVEIEHASLVGPLVRASAAAAAGPPRRDFFIWWDDLEWCLRLARVGRLWLVPAAPFVHKDAGATPLTDLSLRARWREFRAGEPFARRWKRLYGMRNLIFCGRRDGFFDAPRATAYAAVALARALLGEGPRLRTLRLTGRYARAGWRGRFANVPPARWGALAHAPDPGAVLAREALRYDREVDGEGPRPLAGLAAR